MTDDDDDVGQNNNVKLAGLEGGRGVIFLLYSLLSDALCDACRNEREPDVNKRHGRAVRNKRRPANHHTLHHGRSFHDRNEHHFILVDPDC